MFNVEKKKMAKKFLIYNKNLIYNNKKLAQNCDP